MGGGGTRFSTSQKSIDIKKSGEEIDSENPLPVDFTKSTEIFQEILKAIYVSIAHLEIITGEVITIDEIKDRYS